MTMDHNTDEIKPAVTDDKMASPDVISPEVASSDHDMEKQSAPEPPKLQRRLKARHLQMIAMGAYPH